MNLIQKKLLFKILLFLGVLSIPYLSFSQSELSGDTSDAVTQTEEHTTTEDHQKSEKLNISELIFEHVLDAHEFHFFTLFHKEYKIPLPIILYSSSRGLTCFSSARFHEHNGIYNGFKFEHEKIVAVDETNKVIENEIVYDFSLTRNIVQLFIACFILIIIMLSVSSKYKKKGFFSTPRGLQSFIEPVIVFVRDDIAKPNLGKKYEKYLPFLLTIFFFILINNLFGMIPGTANVSGNISFTLLLGVISFIIILLSSNKHFWGHIFNPPVPFFIKLIMAPIEFIGIFTKPVALIIRLFANMLAGHIIIVCIIGLIFVLLDEQ